MRKTKTLYCFGTDHVTKPTAHIAALVVFRVIGIDGRVGYSNRELFPDAFEAYMNLVFNHSFKDFHIDTGSFIVLFTREHLYDRVILEQALKQMQGMLG